MNAREVAVIGAGRMGQGLAHVFAYAGFSVSLIDLKERRTSAQYQTVARQALEEIRAGLTAVAQAGLFDSALVPMIMQRIRTFSRSEAGAALAEARWVFEAVPEVMTVKHQAFTFIDPLLARDAVVTSTTSTFLVDTLAAMVTKPERFLNAHWLNPAHLIPLVEVSPGQHTAPETVTALKTVLEQVGKVPVVCAASPGFIVPRIQALAMNEAARMVAEGVASAEDIDRAIRYGFGFRFAVLGLLEFIDWGGGDILYYASRYLSESLAAERFEAPEIIHRNMAEGRLGIRSGQGFYDFQTLDVEEYRRQTLARFVALLQHIDAARPPAVD